MWTNQHLQQAQRQLQQMAGSSGNHADNHGDPPPSGMDGVSIPTGMSRMGNFGGMVQAPGGVGERITPANVNFMDMYHSFVPQGEGGSHPGGA